ncbi:MAG: efflux RND transporter periplasmic adaptor subunit [Bdellovibrionota bacterium]
MKPLQVNPKIYLIAPVIVGSIALGVAMFSEDKAPADSSDSEDHHHSSQEIKLSTHEFGIDETNIATTSSGEIKEYLTIIGKVELNPNRASHLNPRYPGIVKSVYKSVGDSVNSGTRLATIESNVGLQIYHIASSIDGTVLTRDISIGEYVNEDTEAFAVANTDVLWVHLTVRPLDLSLVKVGDEVLVTSRDGLNVTRGNLFYVSPIVDENTRTAEATLEVANPDGVWKPGMFIDGHLLTGRRKAAVVAPKQSVYMKNSEPYLLVRNGNYFELQEVDLGGNDFDSLEILGGLDEGETIVANITKEIEDKLNDFFDKQAEKQDDHDHAEVDDHGE